MTQTPEKLWMKVQLKLSRRPSWWQQFFVWWEGKRMEKEMEKQIEEHFTDFSCDQVIIRQPLPLFWTESMQHELAQCLERSGWETEEGWVVVEGLAHKQVNMSTLREKYSEKNF